MAGIQLSVDSHSSAQRQHPSPSDLDILGPRYLGLRWSNASRLGEKEVTKEVTKVNKQPQPATRFSSGR